MIVTVVIVLMEVKEIIIKIYNNKKNNKIS